MNKTLSSFNQTSSFDNTSKMSTIEDEITPAFGSQDAQTITINGKKFAIGADVKQGEEIHALQAIAKRESG